MQKTLTSENIKHIKRGVIITSSLFLLANVFTVIINTFSNRYLIRPEFHPIIEKAHSDFLILFTSNILPFPIVIFFLGLYVKPLFGKMKEGNLDENSLRHLANLPLVFSLHAAAGWLAGTVSFQSQLYLRGFTNNLLVLLESTALTACMATISFVLSYYLIEYFQRNFLVPRLFSGNEYNDIPRALRPTLNRRFLIYAVATYALPGFIFFRFLQILNNNGNNVFGRSLNFQIFVMFTIITILVTTITLLVIHSIRAPLNKMQTQASFVSKGDFSTITLVDTRDEIGSLSATMNTMTVSLAEKEFIKDTFGRMVDPVVRDHLLGGNFDLGGTQGEAVVLFSDLEGFTSLSENRSPAEIVSILNRYFGVMSDCVTRHNGIVNKFIGDAILAVFGMPVALESPADNALSCAIAMQKAGFELNNELAADGLPPMHTRIGLHQGLLIAGNIGSASRMEYTVIGDTVNTASRLEGACKKVGVNILFSESLYQSLQGEYPVKKIGALKLKGKSSGVRAYTLSSSAHK